MAARQKKSPPSFWRVPNRGGGRYKQRMRVARVASADCLACVADSSGGVLSGAACASSACGLLPLSPPLERVGWVGASLKGEVLASSTKRRSVQHTLSPVLVAVRHDPLTSKQTSTLLCVHFSGWLIWLWPESKRRTCSVSSLTRIDSGLTTEQSVSPSCSCVRWQGFGRGSLGLPRERDFCAPPFQSH